jgi:hypothetical protein
MSRAFLTAVVATLAVGAFAPRLAAQDTTSANGRVRPDTSGYTGAGGVDTTQRPGRVGADTGVGGVTDSGAVTDSSRKTDTNGLGPASDTSGMNGRRSADSVKPGETRSPSATSTSGMSSDSTGVARPSTRPGQSTSPSSQSPSGP